MAEQDPEELADHLEQETERLARQSREVGHQAEEARQDWQRKRRDENVPGALPPDSGEGPAEDEEEPPPEARDEG